MDRDALLRQANRLLEEEPRTRGELGKLLAECWPDADPGALAYAVTHHIALCQVPPRGIWGKNGPATWAPVESWLGGSLHPVPVDALVMRYLGAFGPATVSEYDNLLLSHKERTRVIPGKHPVPLPPGNGAKAGTFLVDGMWQGTWQIRDQALRVQPFTKLRPADRDALRSKPHSCPLSSRPMRSMT